MSTENESHDELETRTDTELQEGEPLPECFAKLETVDGGRWRLTEKEGSDAWIEAEPMAYEPLENNR